MNREVIIERKGPIGDRREYTKGDRSWNATSCGLMIDGEWRNGLLSDSEVEQFKAMATNSRHKLWITENGQYKNWGFPKQAQVDNEKMEYLNTFVKWYFKAHPGEQVPFLSFYSEQKGKP